MEDLNTGNYGDESCPMKSNLLPDTSPLNTELQYSEPSETTYESLLPSVSINQNSGDDLHGSSNSLNDQRNDQEILETDMSISAPAIDVAASKPASDLEDGQIADSCSSDCSDVSQDPFKSHLKRNCQEMGDENVVAVKKAKKKISFSQVTAYYFPREQGFTCVPSQGGSTLGMALKHTHVESLSLNEHAAQQRKNHRRYSFD